MASQTINLLDGASFVRIFEILEVYLNSSYYYYIPNDSSKKGKFFDIESILFEYLILNFSINY